MPDSTSLTNEYELDGVTIVVAVAVHRVLKHDAASLFYVDV